MRIIGVIDVRGGCAVHARGGQRSAYAPIATAAGMRVEGDPYALARVYVDTLGVRELYLADLDAIQQGVDAMNRDVIANVTALGMPVWVDAGVSVAADATAVVAAGALHVVVGLETLPSLEWLTDICAAVGGDRVAFSVDLRDGRPITMPNAAHADWLAADIAAHAAAAGARTIIVLDLARVGTGAGTDLELLATIRRAAPDVALLAGGGVRGEADLSALGAAGCSGALVATALLDGTLRPNRL